MILKLFFLFVAPIFAKNVGVICNGAYWNYKYEFHDNKCTVSNKASREIPGVAKKGATQVIEESLEKCWESIARIQMDSAVCCIVANRDQCKEKKIKF